MHDKDSLRSYVKTHRADVGDAAYRRACSRILERVRALPEFLAADVVHTYWPVVSNLEIDIRPLIDELVDRSTTVLLPVVRVFGPSDGPARLAHVEYQRGIDMRPNRWNIMEPVSGRRGSLKDIDLIFVPALACATASTLFGMRSRANS